MFSELLNQITDALADLSEHFQQIEGLIAGTGATPDRLDDRVQRWNENYVMHSQRAAHVQGSSSGPDGADASRQPLEANDTGPSIELF